MKRFFSILAVLLLLCSSVHARRRWVPPTVAAPPAGISVVQTVSGNTGATDQASITLTITSSTSGSMIFVGTMMSNAAQVLTPSATGTAQTFTSVGTSSPSGGGQLQCWYVKNCAAGSTAIVVTRLTGVGPWSAVVYEVSGLSTTAPLDVSASSFAQAGSPVVTGTTTTTTAAAEFWVALCGEIGPSDGSVCVFSSPGGSWISAGTTSSTRVGALSNVAVGYAHQIRASTGTASASMVVTNPVVAGGHGFAVTFK